MSVKKVKVSLCVFVLAVILIVATAVAESEGYILLSPGENVVLCDQGMVIDLSRIEDGQKRGVIQCVSPKAYLPFVEEGS